MKKFLFTYLAFIVGCVTLPFLGYFIGKNIKANMKIFPQSSLEQTLSQTQPTQTLSPTQTPANITTPNSSVSVVEKNTIDPDSLDPFLIYDESTNEVLSVSVRDYLIGAVASELPITWPDEALKAQAVACHSYVLFCKENSDTSTLDGAYLSADPTRRQGFMTDAVLRSYWGVNYQKNHAKLCLIVDEVLDDILLYNGSVAAASYFSSSNGKTENSENVWGEKLPYLTSVDSTVDLAADGYKQEVIFGLFEVEQALKNYLWIEYKNTAPENYFKNKQLTTAGYVDTIDVCGVAVKGITLREVFSLRSHSFEIDYSPDNEMFTITTYGYGHGVGLSQWGAYFKAETGQTWQEILTHYFPGTTIGSAVAY